MQFDRFSTYTALSALMLNGFGFVQCESSFSPSNMSGLVAWYNADSMQTAPSIPGAQAGWVPRLGDDSENQHSVATGANINAPIYNATANGHQYINGDVLDNTQMSADGVHPNATGYNYIGRYRVAVAFGLPS